MSQAPLFWRPRPGFTLIELLLVTLLLGLASALVIRLDAQLFFRRDAMRSLLLASPCVQSCAERLIAQRQTPGGYAGVTETACSSVEGAQLSLHDSEGMQVSTCMGLAHCTATISCAGLQAQTLQFYDY